MEEGEEKKGWAYFWEWKNDLQNEVWDLVAGEEILYLILRTSRKLVSKLERVKRSQKVRVEKLTQNEEKRIIGIKL